MTPPREGARRSTPAEARELQRLVWRLRPAVRDLLRGHGVPRDEAGAILRQVMEGMTLQCHRVTDPRGWLLRDLERRCHAWREARRAEEEGETDDGPSGT